MSLLRGFLLLTGFFLLGESIAFVFDWPVSGGVVGMILMTLFLMLRGRVSEDLGMASQSLIAFLTMLIMPGVVGIYFLGEALAGQWLAIAGSLVIGTLLSVLTTLWLMARFMPRADREPTHD
jgi:holin-like protein